MLHWLLRQLYLPSCFDVEAPVACLHSQMLLSGSGGLIANIFFSADTCDFFCVYVGLQFVYVIHVRGMSLELITQRRNYQSK